MKNHRHFVINKPYGYICQFIYKGKRKKRMLGELGDFPEGTMSVGRLDENSEGLLILTTNGKTSFAVRSKGIEKEYYAQVDGIITQDAIDEMKQGVEIGVKGEKYNTLPCEAFKIEDPNFPERSRKVRDDRHGPSSWVSVVVTEGKFRQVRKMTAAVGFPTLRLVRVRIGKLKLGELKSGEYYELDEVVVK
ncbi:MAG: pseudouridine synthase [Crocinitomicaceae bacterium]